MIVVNHHYLKVTENEKMAPNIEVMTITPMMIKTGKETNGNDRKSIMIQIVGVLQTLPEVMIERKARRGRKTNQSPPQNDEQFSFT